MKKIKLSMLTLLLLFLAVSSSPLKSTAQVSVNFQVFYDGLSPYGKWVTYPGYGYVWIPGVAVGFRPYVSGGHWVYSDDGWLWVSNYDWGWAPFHYGSWIDDPEYGWLWVPGYDWAPAWVTWGTYNGYYGWAPVGPGFSISVGYYPAIDHWCFIEPRYMTASDWGNHYYVAHNNRIVINNNIVIAKARRISTISNRGNFAGHGYYSGPRSEEVERTAHATIRPVSLRESRQPGRTEVGANAVSIYRPRINLGTKVYSRPSSAVSLDKIKSARNPSYNSQRRLGENMISGKSDGRPAGKQLQPTYQHPQREKTNNNKPAQLQRNNTAPANHQQIAPQRQQQHTYTPQQRAQPTQKMQQHQPAKRQGMAPQQREPMPREQSPRQEQPNQEGRPKNYR